MLVMIWVQIGYPVVIFMAALQRVDPDLYEAAEIDGAGWFRRFQAITLPQIRPETFVVTLTCTIAALKVFGPIWALTRGGPEQRDHRAVVLRLQRVLQQAPGRVRRGRGDRADAGDRCRQHRLPQKVPRAGSEIMTTLHPHAKPGDPQGSRSLQAGRGALDRPAARRRDRAAGPRAVRDHADERLQVPHRLLEQRAAGLARVVPAGRAEDVLAAGPTSRASCSTRSSSPGPSRCSASSCRC